MAATVKEAEQMMEASRRTGKSISIGYRLHFDPYHQEMIRIVREQVFGKLTGIDSSFSFVPPKAVWRLSKENQEAVHWWMWASIVYRPRVI